MMKNGERDYLVPVRKSHQAVIARSVFCDEAISSDTKGGCVGKKHLAMTGPGIFGQTLLRVCPKL